jgi:EmrB/QacA subfamily drug resistance transporter
MATTNKLNATAPGTGSSAARRQKALILIIACAVVFLDSMDTSTVGIALPSIQHDLSMSASGLQWLVSGYTVAYGGFLLVGGRVADLIGRRKVLIIATVLFILASFVGGAVSSEELIIASRVLKGVAAAFTAPAAFSIITTTFPEGPERNRAVSVYGSTAALGYSLGLIISGLLTSINWRLVFFVPGILAIIVLILVPTAVPADAPRTRTERRSYDLYGGLLVTAAIMLLVYGLVEGPVIGWSATRTMISIALAVILLAVFLIVESRHQDPTLPLSIFRSRTRCSSYVIALALGAAAIGWQFVAVLYLQRILGYSALKTSIAVLPLGVAIFLIAQFVTGRVIGRFGIRAVCAVGMLFQAAGITFYTFVGLDGNYFGLLLPGILLHAVALGMVFASVNIGGVSGVADQRQGVAAGLVIAAYAIGTGLGAAVMATVIAASTSSSSAHALVDAYQRAFVVAAIISGVGFVAAVVGLPGVRRMQQEQGAPAAEPVLVTD